MKSALPRHWPWLLALIPIAFGLARLRFDVEVLNLLPADVPAVQGLKIYQQNFANARELIITVRAPSAESAETCARLIGETLSTHTLLSTSRRPTGHFGLFSSKHAQICPATGPAQPG